MKCPFDIVCDSNETAPYHFLELTRNGKPLIIRTITKALWAMDQREVVVKGETYKPGLADYSISEIESEIQIERKSLNDLYATLGARRGKFEAEISRLTQCNYAAVVIEAGWPDIFRGVPMSGLNPKSVVGTITSWQQRYPGVHWVMAGSRRHAEVLTFKILDRYWTEREKK